MVESCSSFAMARNLQISVLTVEEIILSQFPIFVFSWRKLSCKCCAKLHELKCNTPTSIATIIVYICITIRFLIMISANRYINVFYFYSSSFFILALIAKTIIITKNAPTIIHKIIKIVLSHHGIPSDSDLIFFCSSVSSALVLIFQQFFV